MKFWSRRIVVFLTILGTGLLLVPMARRATVHASTRALGARSLAPAVPVSAMLLHAIAVPSAERASTQNEHAGAPPQQGGSPAPLSSSAAVPGDSSRLSTRPSSTAASAGRSASSGATPGGGTRTFHDPSFKISFDFPANWTFAEKDHEISTFRLDARSADRRTLLRAVTAIPENPYPASTFTGAYVYLSVTPHSNVEKCAQQASVAKSRGEQTSQIAGLKFAHGHDEQKEICTVERDEIYTTYRKGACYRFDLAINNFCGGEVSGVKDVTEQELETVRTRMESIMETVRFDPK